MNTLHASNGLSARQRSIDENKNSLSGIFAFSRHTAYLFIAGLVILTSCQEKPREQSTAQQQPGTAATDSLHKPKVSIQVNRRYDDKGNMIGFDSTYSSYYSNIQGDTARMDTLFNQFGSFFKRNHSSILNNDFNGLFFKDSLMYPDFFHDDFFLKRYELNDAYLRRLMKRMDSVKNNFYRNESKKPDQGKGKAVL